MNEDNWGTPRFMRDLKLPLWCRWGLRSSRLLHNI